MATTNSITTTYAGEFAGKYISAALLSGSTLANNEITILPNVKFKEVVQNVASGNLLSSASCDFTPSSSVTLTERIIEPQELQVNLELCKSKCHKRMSTQYGGFHCPRIAADLKA